MQLCLIVGCCTRDSCEAQKSLVFLLSMAKVVVLVILVNVVLVMHA